MLYSEEAGVVKVAREGRVYFPTSKGFLTLKCGWRLAR